MARGVSSFYPPRARWYSPLLTRTAHWRRRLALDGLRLPAGVSIAEALVSALVPGVGFYVCSPRIWGKVALGLCFLLVFLIVGWFGFPIASIAFGLLLSVHTCGLAFLFSPIMQGSRMRSRILLGLAILVALAGLLYLPARNLVQDHWYFPIRINGRVIIVQRQSAVALRRGEAVAYSFDGFAQHGLIVHGGLGFGPLLALPGDYVLFTRDHFEVNGVSQPLRALMPTVGDCVIPEKHWFVWPELAISGHGYALDSSLSSTVLALGTISERQVIGQPLRRWLWRRQF
jgi:hypothetical protein